MTCFQMQPKLSQGILVAQYLSGIKYLSKQSCGINIRMVQILLQPSWTQPHYLSDLKKVKTWFILKDSLLLRKRHFLRSPAFLSVGTWNCSILKLCWECAHSVVELMENYVRNLKPGLEIPSHSTMEGSNSFPQKKKGMHKVHSLKEQAVLDAGQQSFSQK